MNARDVVSMGVRSDVRTLFATQALKEGYVSAGLFALAWLLVADTIVGLGARIASIINTESSPETYSQSAPASGMDYTGLSAADLVGLTLLAIPLIGFLLWWLGATRRGWTMRQPGHRRLLGFLAGVWIAVTATAPFLPNKALLLSSTQERLVQGWTISNAVFTILIAVGLLIAAFRGNRTPAADTGNSSAISGRSSLHRTRR